MQEKVKPIELVIYSGHCEIVGGDAKYLFDFLKSLDKKKYKVYLYTDKNSQFKLRAKNNLELSFVKLTYLNTRPILFQLSRLDKLYRYVNKQSNFFSRGLKTILTLKLFSKDFICYLRCLRRHLFLEPVIHVLVNLFVFYNVLKKHKNADIFIFNNGGYPGKEAGFMALVWAKYFKIKKVHMVVHNIPQQRSLIHFFGYFYDYITACCDKIIVVSKILKQLLVERRKIMSDKICIVYCGLEDLPKPNDKYVKQKRVDLCLADDEKILLVVGSYSEPRKGHEILLEALTVVKKKIKRFILLIVGDGCCERKSYLEFNVDKFNLRSNVLFLGYRADIHILNAMADISIVPSIAYEATPYVIKEAMRAETAVIASNVGGCVEAVVEGMSGIVVPSGDVNLLAQAICKLLMDEELRRNYGMAGREIFLERFLQAKVIKRLEEIYCEGL